MAVQAIGRVLDHSKQQGSDRLALVVIANNCNREGIAWAGMTTMAGAMGGITRRAMIMRIQALAATPELAVYPRSNGSHHYIPMVYLPLSEFRRAIKWLAKERKTTVHELIVLRRKYATEATAAVTQRIEAARVKRASRVKSITQGGVKSASRGAVSPLHTIRKEPLVEPTTSPNGDSGAGAPTPTEQPLLTWQQRLKAMAQALCEVAALDFAINANEKSAGQVAAPLLKIGYTPDDVRRFKVLWYQREFPGGKRDRIPPSLRAINKYLGWVREQSESEKSYDSLEADYTPPVLVEVELTEEQKQAKADREIWNAAYRQLSTSIPGDFFPTWIKGGCRYTERREDAYVFEALNSNAYRALTDERIVRRFVDALTAAAGRPIEVVFTLASAPTPEAKAAA
jgi:hypothetical protein